MVDRTRTPTAMYPTGYTPSTPSGEVTPEVMTRNGSGEPYNEEMIQDYPCGDEDGHYFISSPLNVYSIGRSGAVVLYVEGGCPDFTWASDNAWATFSSATTSVRYNTISSTSAEGQDTVVTVTDTNGLEVTINVPWNGAASCCEDPPALSIQTPVAEVSGEMATCEVVVFIDGGCPPFAWETTVTSGTAALDYAATNSRRNRIAGNAPCWTLTVTDHCSQTATIGIYPIEMSVLYSYEFDEAYGSRPCAVHLSGEYYAVVYNGPDGDGCIKTFRILTASGEISGIDSYEYQTTSGDFARLLHVSGDVYIVSGGDDYIYTVKISDTGVITKTPEDSQLIDSGSTRWHNLLHVAGNVYAVIWYHYSADETVRTYTISDAGAIEYTEQTYSPSIDSHAPSWVGKVTDNVFFSIRLTDWGGFSVTTYGISDAGVITIPYLDNQAFAIPGVGHGANHGETQVVEITSNIFAMTHQDDEVGATVATFQINDNGTIESSLLDSLLFYAGYQDISRAHIVYYGSGDVYFIMYRGVDGDGFAYLVEITSAGAISTYSPCGETEFEFEDSDFNYMSALSPNNGWFPVFYCGPDSDGWVKTIEV